MLTPSEKNAISSLGINKIYVKFFDVAYSNNELLPAAEIHFDSASLQREIEYVPVIFITQAALLHAVSIDSLSSLIFSKVFRIAGYAGITPKEIQLDCDWAEHTRDKFFRLVENIREIAHQKNIIISCTIRMHQLKYRTESGIPPCDRGMLMFYNMGDWRKPETKNSIFDADEAEKYLPYIKDYPLPLDVALPIFHWAIAYRGSSFLSILGDIEEQRLEHNSIFEQNGDRFTLLRDTFAFGARLQTGDIIRTESCDAKNISDFSNRIFKLLPDEHRSFALYDLDSAQISAYSHEELSNIFPH